MRTLRLLVGGVAATLLIVAAAGDPMLAQTGGDPCSQRNPGFGPDTCATGVFTGEGTTPVGLSCPDESTPPSARTCTGYLASGLDETRLDVTVQVPGGQGPFPLLVGVHGWGGNKGSLAQYDGTAIDAGYVFLRFSTRGFGKSWGQVNLADVNVEGADLRSLIGQVADDPRLHVDPSAVAVLGASYGGAHAWLAAIRPEFGSPGGRPVRIRTVVPIVPWTELLYSLRPNGRPLDPITVPGGQKLSLTEALYVGGLRHDPERPYPNYPAYLDAWHAHIVATEPSNATPIDRQIVDGLSGYRSIYWQPEFWDRVARNHDTGAAQLPVLEVQGFTDDLFPLPEALRVYDRLKAIDPAYPIAEYFGDLGHPRASNKRAEVDYGIGLVFDWLAYYLKGAGAAPAFDIKAAITRPHGVPFSAADVVSVSTYAGLSARTVTAKFSGSAILTFDPANTTGFTWDPVLMAGAEALEPLPTDGYVGVYPPPSVVCGDPDVCSEVATYKVPVSDLAGAPGSLLIAGQPRVSLKAHVRTPSYRVQLDVRLLDVKPDGTRHLVTRGTYTLDSGNPSTPVGNVSVTIPTYGNLWEAGAADTLRLEITNVDSPYIEPSKVPSVTQISKVRLTVPVR